MSDIHILVDMFRMWLLVRIYKKANSGQSTIFLLLFQAKYKFIGVTHQFNDCFMIVSALSGIHLFQYGHILLSTMLIGLAINIKMSAILMVPGFLLVVCYQKGLIISLSTLVIMVAMQILIGLEFLMVN